MSVDVHKVRARVQQITESHGHVTATLGASAEVGQITLKVQHLAMISGH